MAAKSPTTFHNFWGSYAGAANLPNVAAAPTQDAAVQAGDLAYESGAGILYVCTNPALGAAVWAAVGAPDGNTRDWYLKKLLAWDHPGGSSTSTTGIGLMGSYDVIAAGATRVTRNVTAGVNLFQSTRRLGIDSAAGAGSKTGQRQNELQWFRSSLAGMGGFYFGARFGISQQSGGEHAACVGFVDTTAGWNSASAPSNETDCFFFGADVGDANWQIMHNDAAGVCTKVDLGAGMPFPGTVNQDFYQVELYCDPGIVTEMGYTITRLDTGAVVSGTINSNLPTVDTPLNVEIALGNGATAAAVSIDIVSYYVETEY